MKTQVQLIDELKKTELFTQAGLYEQVSPAVRKIFDSARTEDKKATLVNGGGIAVSGDSIMALYDSQGQPLAKGGRGLSMF